MFFSSPTAMTSPTSAVKGESSLLGLDFDVFTLSEHEDVGLSATQSPQNPSNASHVSEQERSAPPSPKEMTMPQLGSNLYVASLPESCTDAKLLQLFTPFGPVVSAKVMCRKGTNVCKGYGFVLFQREEDAAVAQASMIGCMVDGSKIQVRRAHTAASTPLLSAPKTHRRAQSPNVKNATAAQTQPPQQTRMDAPAVYNMPFLSEGPATTPLSPHVQWSYPGASMASPYLPQWNPLMMGSLPPQTAPQVVYVVLPPVNFVQ